MAGGCGGRASLQEDVSDLQVDLATVRDEIGAIRVIWNDWRLTVSGMPVLNPTDSPMCGVVIASLYV